MPLKTEKLQQQKQRQQKQKVAIELYNFLNDEGSEELPEVWEYLLEMSYKELISPLVMFHKSEGKSLQQLAIKYDVTIDTIKYILYKKNNKNEGI